MGDDIFDPLDKLTSKEIYEVTGDWESGNIDMHGYPIYKDVLKVQEELKEQQLREQHPELKEAYENYAKLLAKYGFWEDITK